MIVEKSFGYYRLSRVENGSMSQLKTAFLAHAQTNEIKGVVLDLRYAAGESQEEAARGAEEFLATLKSRPAAPPKSDRTKTVEKPGEKNRVAPLPLVLLVNRETRGASETVVERFREKNAGLVIGVTSAGTGNYFQDFPLKNGNILRVLSNAPQPVPEKPAVLSNIKPDLEVAINPQDELAYFYDAYRVAPRASVDTNQVARAALGRRRVNEAELVRMQREGLSTDPEAAAAPRDTETPRIITDPALARALDLLKGLSLVQQTRSL
jgi:C-terminal processing protease CtpA/Prc